METTLRLRMTSHEPIGIAGTGRIAQALGRLLRERGEPMLAVGGRDPARTEAAARFVGARAVSLEKLPGITRRVLIAVSDDAVTPVAARLSKAGMRGGLALHTCGAFGAEALAPLAGAGVSCAALHPLQTVPSPEQGLSALIGTSFVIDGDAEAAAWAEDIAALLEGQVLRIPSECRPLYHAAAVVASNYAVGLLDAAAILMGSAGIVEDKALRALAPVVRASVDNALTLTPERALTGPIDRGDTQTVSMHLRAMPSGTVRELYRAVGLHVVALARRRGLAEARADELETLLRESERANG